MIQKTALITGITGQDGALLAQYLLSQAYKIIAPTRRNPDTSKLKALAIDQHQDLEFIVYEKWSDFDEIITQYLPDEIYHLAAISHVGESHQKPDVVFDVNTLWTIQLLKAVEQYSRQSKFFFASSCEIFQEDLHELVSENDQKVPSNPYGISKLSAHLMVQYYRDIKGLFACNGILFNHESELRGASFVSKKICREVARIVKNGGQPLYLGNIAAKKDWGYANDYVQAFQSMLKQDIAKDYILASSVLHSVEDMVNCAFDALDYNVTWQGKDLSRKALNKDGEIVVAIDEKFFRPLDHRFLKGNSSKAQRDLDFNNLTPFASWVKSMTLNEYRELI